MLGKSKGKDTKALGELEHHILLAILRLGGDAYTVPIVLELEERTGRAVAPAAVYIALTRLEKKRFLESHWVDQTETGKPRRYFKLEPLATARLKASRRAFARLWEGLEPQLEMSEMLEES